MNRYLAIFAVIILSLVAFQIRCGFSIVDVTNDDWLIESVTSDLPPDYLAWINFRNDIWHYPPGLFGNYSYPNISSIANTGAIPLLAIPAKILSPILPETFQYHGFWLMICWILQGVFAYLLLDRLNRNKHLPNIIGACFFILAAPFLDRIVHMNLCGQWIVLASLFGYYSFQWRFRSQLIYQTLLQGLALHIHPYFILFTLLTGIASLWRFYRNDSGWMYNKILMSITLMLGMILFCGAYLGMFSIGSGAQGWGFGYFSANMNTFVNPMSYSAFLKPLSQSTDGQYEGYAYLGIGLILLVLLSIPFFRWQKIAGWQKSPLFWVTLLLTLFALSTTPGIGKYSVHIPMFKFIEQTAGIFRASGRFIWELYYIIVLAVLGFWIRRMPSDLRIAGFIGLLLVLQIVELHSLWKRNDFFKVTYSGLSSGKVWEGIMQEANLICMVPPYRRHIVSPGDNVHFEYLAANLVKPITSGHLARFDQHLRWDFEERIRQYVNGNKDVLFDQAIWISDPGHIGEVLPLLQKDNTAFLLDRYVVIVPNKLKKAQEILKEAGANKQYVVQTLKDYLELHKEHIILLSVQDDAQTGLSPEVKDWAEGKNALLSRLPFRASYAAIFKEGTLISDTLNAIAGVEIDKNMDLNGSNYQIAIISKGNMAGNLSSIKINRKEYSLNERGINMVILDLEGRILDQVVFDTYSNSYRFLSE